MPQKEFFSSKTSTDHWFNMLSLLLYNIIGSVESTSFTGKQNFSQFFPPLPCLEHRKADPGAQAGFGGSKYEVKIGFSHNRNPAPEFTVRGRKAGFCPQSVR